MRTCPECGMQSGLCVCDEADYDIEDDDGEFDDDEMGIDPEEE